MAARPDRTPGTSCCWRQCDAVTCRVDAERLAIGRRNKYAIDDWMPRGVAVTGRQAITGTIGAEGFFSLLRGRVLETAYSVTNRDQALIVKDLIDTIQGYTEGDALISTSTIAATGKLRDRAWSSDEWKDVGEAIEQLAAVRDGFDFRVRVRWGATKPVREFIISYPATGRPTAFVLELGKNLELLSLAIDATSVASKGYGRGAEQSDGTPLTTTVHTTGTGYPRRDAIEIHSDVDVTSTLLDHVRRRLDRGVEAMKNPTVAVYPDQEPYLGSFVVGDIVEVRGVFGAVDFGGSYRIVAWTATVESNGNERIELFLAPLETFA